MTNRLLNKVRQAASGPLQPISPLQPPSVEHASLNHRRSTARLSHRYLTAVLYGLSAAAHAAVRDGCNISSVNDAVPGNLGCAATLHMPPALLHWRAASASADSAPWHCTHIRYLMTVALAGLELLACLTSSGAGLCIAVTHGLGNLHYQAGIRPAALPEQRLCCLQCCG